MTISDAQGNPINRRHRIFCNRSLNMKNIKAIGFDMDYTLGIYKADTFEVLAYQETLKKLVTLGYPASILEFKFDETHMIRGLAIDKARGNVIKLDRHHYVKVAYHGFRELPREERRVLYDASRVQIYEEPQFALIDTLFSLAEAYLFCQLVELKDKDTAQIPQRYEEIYHDVRWAIDTAHRDGSIKARVAQDPGLYIRRDPHLIETLTKLKESGRKLFVVTNSLWEYTNVVMSYLFNHAPNATEETWIDMFDFVVVGASKPAFFMALHPLYEVDPRTGWLRNTVTLDSSMKVFQGGNYRQLQEMLKITLGSNILYVGDHIYGDILRSKKEIGWRTMLVIEELEHELDTDYANEELRNSIARLMEVKDALDDQLQHLLWRFESEAKTPNSLIEEPEDTCGDPGQREAIRLASEERNEAREGLREHMREYHQRFHPIWGQLMKTGHQNSRFAQQVEVYACLYTSRISNFRFYPPSKSFQSTRDFMPHES